MCTLVHPLVDHKKRYPNVPISTQGGGSKRAPKRGPFRPSKGVFSYTFALRHFQCPRDFREIILDPLKSDPNRPPKRGSKSLRLSMS